MDGEFENIEFQNHRIRPARLLQLELASYGYTAPEAAKLCVKGLGTIKAQRISVQKDLSANNMIHAVNLGFKKRLLLPRTNLKPIEKLSSRMYEVMLFAADGYERDEAAKILGISVYTEKNHRQVLYEKLDVTNMCQAIRVSYEHGIIKVAETDVIPMVTDQLGRMVVEQNFSRLSIASIDRTAS